MKLRLIEDILEEKSWYIVPYKDSSGVKSEVSFYATSEDDAKQLFTDLKNSTPTKSGNYFSTKRKQKFNPTIAAAVTPSARISGKIKMSDNPINIATIEDRLFRTISKNKASVELSTPKYTLLHHKDGYEGNMEYENLVSINHPDNRINDLVHKFLHIYSLNTTCSTLRISHLPIVVKVPVEEYTANGTPIKYQFTMELK